ncbi:MAG: hypothetical protein IJ258_03280 [Methanobrevibacter sp.]|uniref:DUF6398 domain-containing protein n=1 Tax=Methanobrevibacter sp. TaxID=66852 RepID=UPI0025F641F2|nr:DUF6398 domain-containing protein [Methanobrevibacter sp.]MBQ8017109.1 hypothetical protein [Methanobrevibacter sp.]
MEDEKQRQLVEMLTEFCDDCLNEEFKTLNIRMVEKLSQRDDFSIGRDKTESWACAIALAVGQLNFLFDRSFDPFMTQDMLCHYFGVSRANATLKSRDIRRLLELRLGDEEFSTEFVLSMDIPKSDEDLKRIRLLNEVRPLIASKRPDDVNDLKNDELIRLFLEFYQDFHNDEELIKLLRKTFFVNIKSQNQSLIQSLGLNKFRVPLFTSTDECRNFMNDFKDVELFTWPFCNVINYLDNPDFDGVIINPESDGFLISRDMIEKIFKNHENIDYWSIFYMY